MGSHKIKKKYWICYTTNGTIPSFNYSSKYQLCVGSAKISEDKKRIRAEELINLVGMDISFLDRYPGELSGGQKQRVGVARAIGADPEIILMDEPFGAVDEVVRKNLQEELKQLQIRLKKTIVFVTHDIDEAIKLGDRIVIMNNGKIEQSGSPEDFCSSQLMILLRTFRIKKLYFLFKPDKNI